MDSLLAFLRWDKEAFGWVFVGFQAAPRANVTIRYFAYITESLM
jgi:hypothetical protein